MGCFDFTYADNGENMRGRSGYLYLTDAFCKRTGWKSPLLIRDHDGYGHVGIVRAWNAASKAKPLLFVDIYSLYASMLFLAGQCPDTIGPAVERFLERLSYYRSHWAMVDDTADSEYQTSMEQIRQAGIDGFFRTRKEIGSMETVAALGNQRSKTVRCDEQFTGRIPLVITKKKLPELRENNPCPPNRFFLVVRNWGFVSDYDPNQGLRGTRGHYLPWRPEYACHRYTGVTCVNGSCPMARREEMLERGEPLPAGCKDCWYREGCSDCAFFGTYSCELTETEERG